jgi:hypothetical protein
LGQIIPKTAAGLGITDPSDTAQQIFGAAKYLAEGFAKEKTPEGALLYYHGGPDWRKQYGPESAAYVPGVAAHYTRLSKGAGNDNSAPAVPSDEAFLKQAAPSPAAAVPSDEEFLKSTGAAPPQPAETPAPAASNAVLGHLPGASSVTSDAPMPTMPSGLPGDPDETAPAPTGWSAPPIPEPVKRVGGAMADAWECAEPADDAGTAAYDRGRRRGRALHHQPAVAGWRLGDGWGRCANPQAAWRRRTRSLAAARSAVTWRRCCN